MTEPEENLTGGQAEEPKENKQTEKPLSEAEAKLEQLEADVNKSLKYFLRRRRNNRRPALIFKVLTTGLSAVVTILLGLKQVGIQEVTMNNIALGISAFMTIISAWTSFFDYNKLWVQYTKSSDQLDIHLKKIIYYKTGNTHIEMQKVEAFYQTYHDLLQEAANFIYKVRKDDDQK